MKLFVERIHRAYYGGGKPGAITKRQPFGRHKNVSTKVLSTKTIRGVEHMLLELTSVHPTKGPRRVKRGGKTVIRFARRIVQIPAGAAA